MLTEGDTIGPFPYMITRQLGEDKAGMSSVYLAKLTEDAGNAAGEPVVVKIARMNEGEDEESRFFQATLDNEVERLRRLKHPGIVRLLPIRKLGGLQNLPYAAQSELPGNPWFSVMEYLSGGSLSELLNQSPKLELPLALKIASWLSSTLDYLHHRGQVHMDLKPENILFRYTVDGVHPVEPVLIDFGIARDIGQVGLEGGTLRWASPERVAAVHNPSLPPESVARPHPSMDMYALGLILYRMLTGQLPFRGKTKSDVSVSILRTDPHPPSSYDANIPPELDKLVLLCLSKDPGRRPTAEEFAVKIDEIATRQGLISPMTAPTGPVPIITSSGKSPVIGAGMLAGRPAWLPIAAVVAAILILGQAVFIGYTRSYWASAFADDGTPESVIAGSSTPEGTNTAAPSETGEGGVTEGAGEEASLTPTPEPTEVPEPTATELPPSPTATRPRPTATNTPEPTSTPVPAFTPTPTGQATQPAGGNNNGNNGSNNQATPTVSVSYNRSAIFSSPNAQSVRPVWAGWTS